MKLFAKICNMGDASRGSLSSYAYTLMVLHYLQHCQPPLIPVLQKVCIYLYMYVVFIIIFKNCFSMYTLCNIKNSQNTEKNSAICAFHRFKKAYFAL